MGDQDEEWQRKGATLSDKTARAEFGLTQDEIVEAIRAGTLHYHLDLKRMPDPAGDRVVVTLDGTFLPYQW